MRNNVSYSTDKPKPTHDDERRKIAQQMAEYEANGGKVTVLDYAPDSHNIIEPVSAPDAKLTGVQKSILETVKRVKNITAMELVKIRKCRLKTAKKNLDELWRMNLLRRRVFTKADKDQEIVFSIRE